MTVKAKEAVNYTLATHAAERLTLSREAVRLCEKIADGHMTADSAVAQLKRSYAVESREIHA